MYYQSKFWVDHNFFYSVDVECFIRHFLGLYHWSASFHILQPILYFAESVRNCIPKIMLDNDPPFEPRVDHSISKRYWVTQQILSFNTVLNLHQKCFQFFYELFQTSNFFKFGPIENVNQLNIDLIHPNSHF